MALRLSQFNYTIIHCIRCPGESNVANYYYRHPCKASVSDFLEEIKREQYVNMIVSGAVPNAITLDQIIDGTSKDRVLQQLLKILTTNGAVHNLQINFSRYIEVAC